VADSLGGIERLLYACIIAVVLVVFLSMQNGLEGSASSVVHLLLTTFWSLTTAGKRAINPGL
jgi:hypothetical protein